MTRGTPAVGSRHNADQPQVWIVATILVASALLISPWTLDAFMLPKYTLVSLGALSLAALAAWRMVGRGSLALPASWAVVWAAAFLAVALVATVASVRPWLSLIGLEGRYSGLVSYASYAVVFLAVLAKTDHTAVRLWSRSLGAAVGPLVGLGLVQAAGLEPFGFLDNGLPGAFSTFGNVNFAGAWIGAVIPVLAATALFADTSRGWRLYSTIMLPLALVYAVLTETSQAVVVALASLGWAAVLLGMTDRRIRNWVGGHKRSASALVVAALLGAAVLTVALLGPLQAALRQALVERPDFWATALRIWQDHPLVGTGLDTYSQFFLAYRPVSHAMIEGAGTADAPHSVPLAMLSNGGILLAGAYVGFVVSVGIALVRGVVRGDDQTRKTLAGWGGVWIGYQVQSLVSFDVPPLAVLHFVSAGIIVAVAAPPRWREIRLPGLLAGKATRSPGKGRAGDPRPVLRGSVVAAAVLSAWLLLMPLRADLVAASAAPLTNNGQYVEAAARFERAAELNPAEASYLTFAAQGHAAAGRLDLALEETKQAAHRAPGEVQHALFAARIAQELGLRDVTARWYREAARRDPWRVEVLNEVAAFFIARGRADVATPYLRAAAKVAPDNAKTEELLTAVRSR
jgi:O-antigen ligase